MFKSKLNYFAFLVIIVFMFFDGMRSNFIYGSYLSVLRELSVLYLIFTLFFVYNKKKKSKILTGAILLFYLYHSIISIVSLMNDGPIQIGFIFKPYELLFFIYLFYYYSYLTKRKFETLLNAIVVTSVAFSLINVILYFNPLPIWIDPNIWWGRISCGYPTMDVVTLSFVLVLILYYPFEKYSFKKRILISLILFFSILLNFSGTGMAILAMIFVVSLLTCKFSSQKKIFFTFFLVVFLILGSLTSLFATMFPEEYENGICLMENKIDIVLGNEVSQNTLEVREEAFDNVKRKLHGISYFTGIGLNNMSMVSSELEKNKNLYQIESQYNMLLMGYGLIGLILYVLIFIQLGNIVIRSRLGPQYKIMFMLLLVIVLMNSYTLISLMIFPNSVFYSILISMIIMGSKSLPSKPQLKTLPISVLH